jgi:hypothetical protein
MTTKKEDKDKPDSVNDKPVMIGATPLTDLVQPIDFSGAASAGAPTRVHINKPRRDEWVTVRTGDEWRLATFTIEEADGLDREHYIISNELAQTELADDARFTNLFLATSSTGRVFFWAVKMSPNGRRNHWAESAQKAVEIAEGKWIRVIPASEGYEIELIKLAFEDRIIDTMDHPVAKRLTLGG